MMIRFLILGLTVKRSSESGQLLIGVNTTQTVRMVEEFGPLVS